MADSHSGAFGIVAVILLLLLKYALLISLQTHLHLPALLCMTTVSRWIMVSSLFLFPSAKTFGMGYTFKLGTYWYRFVVSTAIAAAIAFSLLSWKGLLLILAVFLISYGIASYFSTKLSGLTGDNYGALCELSEVLVLIIVMLLALVS